MRFGYLLPWLTLVAVAGLSSSQVAASEVDAAGYYKLRCASCHGSGGEGTRDKSPSLAPPLLGNPFVINAPVELLMSVIRNGRSGQQRVYDDAYPNMPAFDAGMVPDARGLATYLKTVLQRKESATEEGGPAMPPANEQVAVPGDAVTLTDADPVVPRHADDVDNEASPVPPGNRVPQ